jgi:hypothetical protein
VKVFLFADTGIPPTVRIPVKMRSSFWKLTLPTVRSKREV